MPAVVANGDNEVDREGIREEGRGMAKDAVDTCSVREFPVIVVGRVRASEPNWVNWKENDVLNADGIPGSLGL